MYEHYFKFREKPFSLLPDPDFLYLGEQHKMALYMLRYGVTNQAGFIVITGEVGCGKTILVRQLLNELEVASSIGLISDTHQSQGPILNRVLMAFNLDYSDANRATLYARLVDYLVAEYAQNRRVVLIVDEAQNMDAANLEELRTLSNVNADKDQLIQLLLLGQPELRQTLRQTKLRQFAQRISVYYHLEPLNEQQTSDYIRHRLVVAGGDPNLFTDGACNVVYQHSLGVPRLINRLCDTSLLYAYGGYKAAVDHGLVAGVARDLSKGGLTGLPEFPRSIVDYAPTAESEDGAVGEPVPSPTPPKPANVVEGFGQNPARLAPNLQGSAENETPILPDLGQPRPVHAAGASAPPELKVVKELKIHSVAPLRQATAEHDALAAMDRIEPLPSPSPLVAEPQSANCPVQQVESFLDPKVTSPPEPTAIALQATTDHNRIWIGALIVLFLIGAIGFAIYEHVGLSLFGQTANRDVSLVSEEFWNSAAPPGAKGAAMLEQINELLVQAHDQREAGALESALDSINQVLVLVPNNTELIELRAALEKGIRDRERQRAKATRRSREVASLAAVARELKQAGDLDGAAAAVSRGLSLDPENAQLQLLGEEVNTARLRSQQDAQETRLRRIEVAKLLKMAKAQQARGEVDQALISVGQGLALEPENIELRALLRTLRAQLIEQRRRAVPDDTAPESGRGNSEDDSRRDASDAALERPQGEKATLAHPDESTDQTVGTLTPNQPQANLVTAAETTRTEIAQFVEKAKAERNNGDLDLAVVSLNRAFELAPDNGEVGALLQELRTELAEQERVAEKQREQALAALVDQANQHWANGELEAARNSVDSALAGAPGHETLLKLQADLQAAAVKQQEVTSLRKTAHHQFQSGDWQASLEATEQGLALDADNRALLQLRAALEAHIRNQTLEKAEEERRQQRISKLLSETYEHVQAGEFGPAKILVRRGLILDADNTELLALDDRVMAGVARRESEADARRRRLMEIDRSVGQASAERDRGELVKALETVGQGLTAHAAEPALTLLRTQLQAALAEIERQKAEAARLQREKIVFAEGAKRLLMSGDLESARQKIDQGLENYPNDAELKRLADDLIAAEGKRDQLTAILQQAQQQRQAGNPKAGLAIVDRGMTLDQGNKRLLELRTALQSDVRDRERAEQARRQQELGAIPAHGSADVAQLQASVDRVLEVDLEKTSLVNLSSQAVPNIASTDVTLATSKYVIRGNRYLAQGDVASARLFYEVAAATGDSQAMLAVGSTYDPIMIGQRGLHVHTDALQAARWYRKAWDAGAEEAQLRLQALAAWLQQNERRLSQHRSEALRTLLAN